MSSKYSTQQQHEPLRVPSNWGREEKRFVAQLEELLDDLYRRFNRLRIEDLGTALRKTITETSDGVQSNSTEIRRTAEAIETLATQESVDELGNAIGGVSSVVTQNAQNVEMKFNKIGANGEATKTGITTVTENGVKVEHSNIGGHTEINADGMRMYDAAGNLVGGMYKSGEEVKSAATSLMNPKHGNFEVVVAPFSFEGEQVGISFKINGVSVGSIDAYNNGSNQALLINSSQLSIGSGGDIQFSFYAKDRFTGEYRTMYLTASEIWHAVSMIMS